ncbi:hypothetical protein [Alsobacter sp. SYSU BS001988]
MSMSTFGKPLLTAVAAAAALFGVSAATVTPAEAGASTGTWRAYPGGVYRGGYGGGYGRHAYGGGPRYYNRHRGGNWGGAAAAGAIGGLALGALAAGSRGGDCYWTTREVYDGYGYSRMQRVRVCD